MRLAISHNCICKLQGLLLVRWYVGRHAAELFAVLEDGPVKTLADLKGKKVGYSVAGVEEALLTGMLARYDVKFSDIELISKFFFVTRTHVRTG